MSIVFMVLSCEGTAVAELADITIEPVEN